MFVRARVEEAMRMLEKQCASWRACVSAAQRCCGGRLRILSARKSNDAVVAVFELYLRGGIG
jgi:hypothetical protein